METGRGPGNTSKADDMNAETDKDTGTKDTEKGAVEATDEPENTEEAVTKPALKATLKRVFRSYFG